MLTDFNLALYNWRCAERLTQAEAAEKLGVSAPSLSKWESGKAQPRAKVVARLSPIIGYEPAKPTPTEDEEDSYVPFSERMGAYMARTRGMVAEREWLALPRKSRKMELARLAGFLDALINIVPVDLARSQKYIDTLEELLKEVNDDEREDD